jgi:hypothetical protein
VFFLLEPDLSKLALKIITQLRSVENCGYDFELRSNTPLMSSYPRFPVADDRQTVSVQQIFDLFVLQYII